MYTDSRAYFLHAGGQWFESIIATTFLDTSPSAEDQGGFFYGLWMHFERNRVWLSLNSQHPDGSWSDQCI
jgi:hypothetical protein